MPIATPIYPMMIRLFCTMVFVLLAQVARADITPFVGKYVGTADVVMADGTLTQRDMSVEIAQSDGGFNVSWSSITYKSDGRIKEKSYSINFVQSERPNVYAAAQRKNVFGHAVQLDPMKGEPFVWARINGETLTVFSLFVSEDGGYEMQQFDRTLRDGGLQLDFSRVRNGERLRSVSTLLLPQ